MMLDRPAVPEVSEDAPLNEVLDSINKQNLGFTLVVSDHRLLGIITDGDLRRALEKGEGIYECRARDLMTLDPLTIRDDRTAAEALEIMEEKLITGLAVLDDKNQLTGIIHLHDLLGRGQVRFAP
jgi:arabinose-5-phosphate isomerase